MRVGSCLIALALSMSCAAARAADLRTDVGVFAARFGWPGAVALDLDRTSVRDAVAYGVCRDGVPLTFDTPLLIGSVSKAFTAQGALSLAERGRLDLDAPVGLAVPAIGAAADRVTPRELLTHTSGFTSRQGMSVERDAQLASVEPAASPGKARYSNLNYNLLGAVISARYGAPFPDALKRLVAARFGLTTLAVGSDGARSCGHTLAFGAVIPRPEPRWSHLVAPAGFLQASASDLAKLEWALLADPRSGRGGPLDPVIGWKRATIGGQPIFSHSGQIGGARATIVLAPERGRGLVLVVNRGGDLLQDPVDDLALRAMSNILNRPPKPVPWPWERVVRFAALAALVFEGVRLFRACRRRPQGGVRSRTTVLAAATALGVPAAVLYGTGLTPAALWRLAPDLSVLLALGPCLAATRWALLRSDATSASPPRLASGATGSSPPRRR